MTYHIVVERAGEAKVCLEIPESVLPPETLNVIDDLLALGRRGHEL